MKESGQTYMQCERPECKAVRELNAEDLKAYVERLRQQWRD
jgi:hypothetical protein